MFKGILAVVALVALFAVVGREISSTNDAVDNAMESCSIISPQGQAAFDIFIKGAESASTEDDQPTDE